LNPTVGMDICLLCVIR